MGENGRGLLALVALGVLGCGSSSSSGAKIGDETGACYPNHTCNEALTCLSDLCVRVVVDGGGAGSTGAGSGGSGGTMRDADGSVSDSGSTTGFQPAPHPRMPQVANLGGPVLDAPKVQPIFYAADLDQAAIGAFLTALASSAYWPATTSEYGVGPLQILPPVVLTTTPPLTIDDDSLEAQLVANTASAAAPWGAADPQTIYLYVLPQGTNAVFSGGATCCQDFGGYHLEVRSNGVAVPYAVGCSCPGALGPNLSVLQERTVAISHELIEAATDPLPRSDPAYTRQDFAHYVWTFLTGGEVGDLCAFNPDLVYRLPGTTYSVQRSWSNAAAERAQNPCVPAPTIGPYVNAFAALDPIAFGAGVNAFPTQGLIIPLGTSRTVPVTLYSTGPSASWTVTAYTYEDFLGGDRSNLGVALDKSEGVNGDTLHLMLTPRAANPNVGGEVFVLLSQYGHPGDGDYQTNLSVGLIGN